MLPSLMSLDLSKNVLGGLPTDLGDCEQLKTLRCPHNQIRELTFLDLVPDPLPSLVEVNFDRNGLQEIPPALWTCPKLKHVSLCANRLELAALHMLHGDGEPVAPSSTSTSARTSSARCRRWALPAAARGPRSKRAAQAARA